MYDINLYIIKKELEKYYTINEVSFADNPTVQNCRYAELLEPKKTAFRTPVLYVGEGKNLPEKPTFQSHPCFVVCGKAPMPYYKGDCNILTVDGEVSVIELFNQVQKVFNSYREWQERMQKVIDEKEPIRQLGMIGFSKLGNPFLVQGSGFKSIIQIIPAPTSNASVKHQDYYSSYYIGDNSFMGLEEIMLLSTDDEYKAAEKTKGVQLYHGEPYGFRSMFVNVVLNEMVVARICMDEIIKDFEEYDEILLLIFSEYVRKKLADSPMEGFQRPAFMDEILTDLLRHKYLPEEKIVRVLASLNWQQEDSYVLMLFKPQVFYSEPELVPMAYNMSLLIPNSYYQIVDGNFLLIVNLTRAKLPFNVIIKHCVNFIRDNMMKTGISMEFQDFKELFYYYRQAKECLYYGEKTEPHLWYHHYEDLYLEILLSRAAKGFVASELLCDGLKRIKLHDEQKNTRYLETLLIYLQNERSIADTARATYQHRNTLIYQLEQIQKILDMNLEDPAVRLKLLMMYQILEYKERGIMK